MMEKRKFSTVQLVRIALLGAVLYAAQAALAFLPNVELVSLLILIYTLVFGRETFWMIVVFNLFEGLQWGFGMWWVTYLYVWPLLMVVVLLLKRLIREEFVLWAVVLGFYGLSFGAFFSVVYVPVDPYYALTSWITGLPWDVWHAAANSVICLLLGKPLYRFLYKLSLRW